MGLDRCASVGLGLALLCNLVGNAAGDLAIAAPEPSPGPLWWIAADPGNERLARWPRVFLLDLFSPGILITSNVAFVLEEGRARKSTHCVSCAARLTHVDPNRISRLRLGRSPEPCTLDLDHVCLRFSKNSQINTC